MDKLEQKYINNNLTSEELKTLREEVNMRTEKELEDSLRLAWHSVQESSSETHELTKIKRTIDERLFHTVRVVPIYMKLIQIAAIILFPIFMITTIYLYRENTKLSSNDFIVSTGVGEQVTVTLPDSTKVTLNSESCLSYNLSDYNSRERSVRFDGEGYFQVVKNPSTPFTISARGLKVSVLGTIFNLKARSSNSTAELSLEEGSVRFYALKSGRNVILSPNQKAILDQKSGNVIVEDNLYVTDTSAWRRGELVFRNVPLVEVLDEISKVYNLSITMDEKVSFYKNDLFTGVMSRTNINEVLEVIEHSYHLKAKLKDGKIHLVNLN